MEDSTPQAPESDNTSSDVSYSPDDPVLMDSLFQGESNQNPNAVSGKGAMGLGQIMPGTWKQYSKPGENPYRASDNKAVSQRVLSDYYKRYNGDIKLALGAYNAGPGTIDKYIDKTQNGTWEEVSDAMAKDNAYGETRNYVPKILANYESKKKGINDFYERRNQGQEQPPAQNFGASSISQGNSPGNINDFKSQVSQIVNDPTFGTLSATEQVKSLNKVLGSKQWTSDVYGLAKNLATQAWQGAEPGEAPDFSQLVGQPPVVPKGQDPKKALDDWKYQSMWNIRKQGLNPALLGNQLDQYFDSASKNEMDAYTYRNESWSNAVGQELKGGAKELLKGGLSAVTGIEAGVTRLVGSLENPEAANMLADEMDRIPERAFGSATDNGFYARDENGRIKKNPDGTPQANWQQYLWEPLGNLVGFGGATVAGKLRGASQTAIWAANTGAQTLQMADGLFKSTYEDTKDIKKAYEAAAFALPAAATFAVGEAGIVGGALRPSLKGLTFADKARFTALNATRNAIQGGLTNMAADSTVQAGMSYVTGKPFDTDQTERALLQGAGGAVLPGLFYDYVGEPRQFQLRERARSAQIEKTAQELQNFRYSLDNSREIQGQKGDVSENHLNFLGLNISGETPNGFIVSKNSDVSASNVTPEDLPTVLENIRTNPAPNELERLGQRQAVLANKENPTPEEREELNQISSTIGAAQDPTHLYTSNQVHENALRSILSEEPGALPIEYSPELKQWRNVETGETGQYAKDLLYPYKASENPVQDVSDISDISINDKDALLSEGHPQREVEALTNNLKSLQDERSRTSDDLVAAQKELETAQKGNDSADKENTKIEKQRAQANAKRQELQGKIDEIQKQISDINERTKGVDNAPSEAQGRTQELSKALETQQAETLRLRNKLQNTTDPNEREAVRSDLKSSIQAEREHRANILDLKNKVRDELSTSEALEKRKSLESQQALLQKRLEGLSDKLNRKPVEKTDTAPIESKIQELQQKLETHRTNEEALKSKIKDKKNEALLYNKKLKSIESTEKEGFGSYSPDEGINIGGGLEPEAKRQVIAHEIAHVVQDRLSLPDNVKSALNAARQSLSDQAGLMSADELASRALLPAVKRQIPIPESATGNDLRPSAKNAILGEREFEANQLAAAILKKNGHDIGNFEIVPELENYLRQVKLPELPDTTVSLKNEPTRNMPVENVPSEARNEQETGKSTTPTTSEGTGNASSPSGVSGSTTELPGETGAELPTGNADVSNEPHGTSDEVNSLTGNKKETAFSKTVREQVPEMAPVNYDERSRSTAFRNGESLIKAKGYDYLYGELTNSKSKLASSPERIAYADALISHATAEVNNNPTPENMSRLSEATQLRAISGTQAAQTLALAQRFRGTKTFGDFVATLARSLREGGAKESDIDFMLRDLGFIRDLKESWRKYQAAPEGKVQDAFGADVLAKGMLKTKTTWPEWLKGYYKNNLLSGPSTMVRVFTGHSIMGPIFTALSHPLYGGGMNWRVMKDTLPLLGAQTKLIWNGEYEHFVNGLAEPLPIALPGGSVASNLAKVYNKFGSYVPKTLGTISNAMTTLSERMGMTQKKYQEFLDQYKNDPQGFSTAASKLLTPPEELKNALAQAENENAKGNLGLSEAQKMVRAYEILDNNRFNDIDKQYGKEYGDSLSLRGGYANPVNKLVGDIFQGSWWNKHPVFKFGKDIAFPFINALNHITDYSTDFIPGAFLVNHGQDIWKYMRSPEEMKPDTWSGRSEALHARLIQGQVLGTVLTGALLGLSRSGIIQITGDPEITQSKNKALIGGPAKTGPQFKEFEEKGIPDHSIILPNGVGLKYDDIPGLNVIAYGLYHANKAVDSGEGAISSAWKFFSKAFTTGVPIFGNGSLNAPYKNFLTQLLEPHGEDDAINNIGKAFTGLAKNAAQGAVPLSSLWKNVQRAYADPTDSHVGGFEGVFKDMAGFSSLVGSRPATDRFGEPIQRSLLEHTPFSSVLSEQKTPTDPTWEKLNQRGLIVPEMKSSIKWNKSDFPSAAWQTQFESKRAEDRLTKAYTDSFTPDEWYQFRTATGPHVKRVADQIASSSIPTDRAQDMLNQRVAEIERNAKRHYILTGKFSG